MVKKNVIVGSRGSRLALLQAETIIEQLRRSHHELEFSLRKIITRGDSDRRTRLTHLSGQGVFVKELEESLLSGEIDMAVHSLKDVPTDIASGLKLAAAGMRIDARDAFISESGALLGELPMNASVGTGSERRAVQLKALRPDIQVIPLRGNIDTRLKKLYSGKYDGIIIAAAAMIRMGWEDKIVEYLPFDHFLPSVGQGALAVEIRETDRDMAEIVSVLNDNQTWQCVQAERAFLSSLGGGCRAPIAASGYIEGDVLTLDGMVSNSEGTRVLRSEEKGNNSDYIAIGRLLAQKLFSMGANELLGERGK